MLQFGDDRLTFLSYHISLGYFQLSPQTTYKGSSGIHQIEHAVYNGAIPADIILCTIYIYVYCDIN